MVGPLQRMQKWGLAKMVREATGTVCSWVITSCWSHNYRRRILTCPSSRIRHRTELR